LSCQALSMRDATLRLELGPMDTAARGDNGSTRTLLEKKA
jgi:hypothetical protein